MKTYTDDYGINQIINLCKDDFLEKEFYINFNIQKLEALHIVLHDYLRDYLDNGGSSCMSAIYKSKNKKNKYFSYIVMNYKGRSNIYKFEDDKISRIFKQFVFIFIEMDIKNYKKIQLKCYRVNTKNEKIEAIIDANIDKFFKRIELDVKNIIDSISNCEYINSGLRTYLGMFKRELVGYYKTKYFEIDAGGQCKYPRVVGKKIKIKYSFSNILVKKPYDNSAHITVDTTDIYVNVINKLLQLLLRENFKNFNNQKYINNNHEEIDDTNLSPFDESFKGKTKRLEKSFEDIDIDFCRHHNLIISLPLDIDSLIDSFFKLNNKQQEIYYNSCRSYESALNSNKLERLFHLYTALENIVVYEEKYTSNLKGNRLQNIQNLIERYINTIDCNYIVEWWYNTRNKYVHNGIDNSGIFDLIYSPDFPAFKTKTSYCYFRAEDYFEALVHFVLIKWLEQQ